MINDGGKSDRTELVPDLAAAVTQISSDATRRFYEQGQTVAKTVSEWSAVVNQFVSHRVARNSETIGRVSKCQNLPEVFAIQTQWLHDATDDYLKEMDKLMEVNSKIMGGPLATVGRVEDRASAEIHPSPAKI